MNAERIFAGLAIASFAGLVLLLAWPRKRPPVIRPTVPASRWPPHIEP
jgi:hypothetical protein